MSAISAEPLVETSAPACAAEPASAELAAAAESAAPPTPADIAPADRAPSELAAPPEMGRLTRSLSDASRSAFRYLNRGLMVPIHRAGLAAWLGNPASGWQLLLTTTGRKSGLHRDTPLGYIVAEGAAWVMAGYGAETLWYRNLLADPRVEVLMPARPAFAATAESVTDPAVRLRIIPALTRSMALPGSAIGSLPATTPDDRIDELTSWIPLIALRPASGPLVAGPDDPGGHAWVVRQVVAGVSMVVALRALAGLVPRRHR